MTPQAIHQQLVQLNQIMDTHPLESQAYREAFEQYDQLLFGYVTMRDVSLIKDYLPQPIPADTIALMIATVMNHRPITDVINVPALIQCALLVRWGRKQKGLTQVALAEQMEMTQSQIAKIESAANGVTAEVMGKLAKILDVTFTISPTDPLPAKTFPKKAS